MSAQSLSEVVHQGSLTANRRYKADVKAKPSELGADFDGRLASVLQRIPRVAIFTLVSLAAQDLTQQAAAMTLVDTAGFPQTSEANAVGEDVSIEKSASTEAVPGRGTVTLPESLSGQEFAPEPGQALELSRVRSNRDEGEDEREQGMSTVVSLLLPSTQTNIAAPETEGVLEGSSVQGDRARATEPTSPPSATLAIAQSHSAQDLQTISNPLDDEVVHLTNRYSPQQTQKPLPVGEVVAQAESPQSCFDVEGLQSELRALEELRDTGEFRASPALSVVIPTAFGADNNTGFVSATYQARTRFSNQDDGALGIGIGLGDARKGVGVEVSYAIASFGSSRDFGSGGFNVKVHRQLGNDWAVAAGWNGFVNVGGQNDFEQSLYGVVSKVLRLREDINSPFSRVALSAGVGSGQFRSDEAIDAGDDEVNVFGNIAVRIARPISLIAEWSGQDLGVGLSVAPFKNIPLVITPAVRDITGAGDGARFVLGTGFAFRF